MYQPWTLLATHLAALRAVPRFSKCRFALIIECNLDQGAPLCEKALIDFNDCDIVCATRHSYGIYTTPATKPKYFARMKKLMGREAIAFYETIVSASPFQTGAVTRKDLAAANMLKFEQEFRSFRYIYMPPSLTSIARGIYTGKADHENKFSTRMQDDLVMACAFGISAAIDTLSDPPMTILRSKSNKLY